MKQEEKENLWDIIQSLPNDPEYKKIFVDDRIGLADGRYNLPFLEKAKKKPNYDVLFRSRFASEDAVDSENWSVLIPESKLRERMREETPVGNEIKLGLDVAHGGDCWNVWTLRWPNFACILRKDKESNLMAVAGQTAKMIEEFGIQPESVTIDGTGIGAGVVDRLWQLEIGVNSFIAGEKARDTERFFNRRSESAWALREWLLTVGFLSEDADWLDCLNVRWKTAADKKVRLMSKEEMAKRLLPSPDCFDSLMMTFAEPSFDRPTEKLSKELEEFLGERKVKEGQDRLASFTAEPDGAGVEGWPGVATGCFAIKRYSSAPYARTNSRRSSS